MKSKANTTSPPNTSNSNKELIKEIQEDYFLWKKGTVFGTVLFLVLLFVGGWVVIYKEIVDFTKGKAMTDIKNKAESAQQETEKYLNKAKLAFDNTQTSSIRQKALIDSLVRINKTPHFSVVCNQSSNFTQRVKTTGRDSMMLIIFGSGVGTLTLFKLDVVLDGITIGTMQFYNNLYPEGHMPFTPLIVTLKNRHKSLHECKLEFKPRKEEVTLGKSEAFKLKGQPLQYAHLDENDFFSVLLYEY